MSVGFCMHFRGHNTSELKADDGAAHGRAGCGWEIWGCRGAAVAHTDADWMRLAKASWQLPARTQPLEAEFSGLLSSVSFLAKGSSRGRSGRGGWTTTTG